MTGFREWMFSEDNPYTLARMGWPSYTSNPDLMAKLPPVSHWFHGSSESFDKFKMAGVKRRVSHWNNFLGTHFSSDPSLAHKIASLPVYSGRPGGGFTYDVELDINNPLDVGQERDMDVQALQMAYRDGVVTDKDITAVLNKRSYVGDGGSWSDRQDSPKELIEKYASLKAEPILNNLGAKRRSVALHYKKQVEAMGHDGIIYKSSYPGEGYALCAIAFKPEQIKIVKRAEAKADE